MDTAPRPLAGILVADFSRVVAGPMVATILGDLGATVIKVERPGTGDDTRSWGPPWIDLDGEATSAYYLGINRGKRSVQLDLRDAADLDAAQRLADRADVLVENFKPGTLDRVGLGWPACAARNPRLVYCTILGFGDEGTAAEMPGYDLLAQAASGLMSITGEAEGRPLKTGVAVVDVLTALYATIGVTSALAARAATGRGERVRVSLIDAAMAALLNQGSAAAMAGVTPTRGGNDHPSIAPYSTYTAADRDFVIACGNDSQFAGLAAAVAPSLADDERFASNASRVAHRRELDRLLHDALATQPADHWIAALRAAGVPAGPINTIPEAFELLAGLGLAPVEPTASAYGTVVPTVRSPIRLGDGNFEPDPGAHPRSASPRLGADDAWFREWLDQPPPGAP